MAKNYTQPQLTTHGNIEELTQILVAGGTGDFFYSASGQVIAQVPGASGNQTAPGPVVVPGGTPTGAPIS